MFARWPLPRPALPPSSISIRRRRCYRNCRANLASAPARSASLMTASTAAIALTAPFTGALADVLGRKRLITIAAFRCRGADADYDAGRRACRSSCSGDSCRGCCCRRSSLSPWPMWATNGRRPKCPGWPGCLFPARASAAFCGRFFTGAIADLVGWRVAFAAVALLTLAGGADRHAGAAARAAASFARAASSSRCGKCWPTCAIRGCWRSMPSASACCSTSSPPSPT